MAREAIDLYLTDDGDLAIENGDFKLAAGDAYKLQAARNRIKSIQIDWFYDHIGADMEEIIGEPNTKDTADRGTAKMITSLTEDGLFDTGEVFVKNYPIGKNSILYIIMIKSTTGKPIVLNVTLDLVKGVVIE